MYLDRGRAKAAKSALLSTGKISSTNYGDICTKGVSALGWLFHSLRFCQLMGAQRLL